MAGIDDEYDLQRFVEAQSLVYESALKLLRRGEMCSPWMSLIFPSFTGCYHDPSTEQYAIRSLDEARAYLAHVVLGSRYRETIRALDWLYDADPADLMSERDLKSLHSSLTLFAEATDEPDLREMLAIWFGCRAEELTMSQLNLQSG